MEVQVRVLIGAQAAYDIAREMRDKPSRMLTRGLWLRFIKSEHSPIRVATYKITMVVPYWVAMHFRTHWVGALHFVATSRTDIIGQPRDVDRLVKHIIVCNPQSLVNIARKRLCYRAAKETREVMEAIQRALAPVDAELAKYLQPDCEYRKGCYELKSCGWYARCCKERLHDLP